jgi:sarcosine oxidase
MTLDHSQYVVVGAGLAGAATAWQLAAAGHQVSILERGVPADASGSSHGSARIFRYAYPSEVYTRLVTRARDLWSMLERESGIRLITPTGALDFGERRDPEGLARILETVGIEHELLTLADATRRWPQFTFDSQVLWHPGAGVIDAETSVRSMVELARANGARLLTGWAVDSVEQSGHGYLLRDRKGRLLEAERVVIAAGGWLPRLLGSLALPREFVARFPRLEVRQEQAYHFPFRDPSSAWPAFIHKNDRIQTYGLPGGRDADFRGQKVAQYNGGKVLPSAAEQDGVIEPANRDRVVEYVRTQLPGLSPEPYAETTCLFTNTPTEDFVLDRCEGITVVSACLGQGAKFAPLIGALAADAASATDPVAARASLPEQFLVPGNAPAAAGAGALR